MNAVGGKFGLKRYWLLPRADYAATALTRNKIKKVMPTDILLLSIIQYDNKIQREMNRLPVLKAG